MMLNDVMVEKYFRINNLWLQFCSRGAVAFPIFENGSRVRLSRFAVRAKPEAVALTSDLISPNDRP